MKNIRLILLVTLLTLLAAGQGAWAQTGSDMPASITYHDNGDNTGYYEIGSPQALYDLQVYVLKGTYSDNSTNESFHSCYNLEFRQTADIDMSGINGFTGIGKSNYIFSGHYNGQDHAVRNLTINDGRGLFGELLTNVVEHVIVDGAAITGGTSIGGIAGFAANAYVQNCFVLNTEITTNPGYASPNSGAIVGNCDYLSGCIYYNCSVHNATANATSTTNIGNGANADDDDNCRRVQKITLGTGVSATGTGVVNYNGNAYCPPSTVVTLGCTAPDGYHVTGYSVKNANNDDVSVSESAGVYSFSMPDGDVTVSASLSMNWVSLQYVLTNSSTDANNPTVITLDQDFVAESTDNYLNIPAGHHVIIDLNGHKIDRNLTEATNGGSVIQVRGNNSSSYASLTIRDTQGGGIITGGFTSSDYGGGAIFVNNYSTLTIEGGTITGNKCANNGGGAISASDHVTVRMTGGSITGNVGNTQSNYVFCAAGAVYLKQYSHFYLSGGSITDNLCGGHTGDMYGKDDCGGIGFDSLHDYVNRVHLSGSYTLSGNLLGSYSNGTLTNSIPSDYLHTQKNVIVIEDAISPTAPAVITVSDKSTQACFTSGWGNHMTADPATCFTLGSFYNTSEKSLRRAGSELYIGTPEAIYWHADANHDGTTAEKAYEISTPEGLDYLASVVNGGNECKNKFFKLGADIAYNPNTLTVDLDGNGTTDSNYTPIGNNRSTNIVHYSFRGSFDGQGHTISGIRAYRNEGYGIGLFSTNNDGTITGIVLRDCSFGGYSEVGGIAGRNAGTISDCRVESTVSILVLPSASNNAGTLGGITGFNWGTISGCLSAAAVNPEAVSANVVGGIAGTNYYATIQDCLYVGTAVNATGEAIGAICGSNQTSYSAHIANTYYVAAPNLPGQSNTYSHDSQRGVAYCGRGYEIVLNEGADFFDNARAYPVSGLSAYAKPDIEEGAETISQFGYALQYTPANGGESAIYSYYQQGVRLKSDLALSGYAFGGYAVSASNAEPVDVSHNTGNDGDYYYFLMPRDADVTVTAIWTTGDKALTGAPNGGFYWATWFSHARFALPEGAAAYTMDKDHHLYRLGDDGRTIPAGVAVVIISDKADIALTLDSGTSTVTDHAPNGGNILRGSDSAVTVTDGKVDGKTPHVLGIVGSTIGFHPFTGTEIPANKAYYVTTP